MPLTGLFSWARCRSMMTRGLVGGLMAAVLAPVFASTAWALEENEYALFGIEKPYNNKDALDQLQKALDVFRQGKGDEALTHLEKAAAKDKTLAPGRVLRARMLFALNAQQAITAARAELEQSAADAADRTNPHVYLMLGNLALAEGRLTDAELEYAKAASLIKDFFPSSDPKNPDLQRFQRQIYTGQTSVAEGRRDWKGAKSSAAQWMAVAGTDKKQIAQAELRMARAEFFSDDLASAKDHLQAAYKNDPEVGHPLVSLALLTAQKGDKDNPQRAIDEADKYMLDAVSQIKNESTAKPETVAAVYAAASQWMLNNNKLSDAARYASDAVKADPKSDAFQRLTALIALYQKNWIEAEKLLDGMYQKSPGDVFVTANLSLALAGAAGENTTEAEKAKMKKAVDLAEINFKSNQKSAELAATLGWIYFRAGRYDEAEQLLQGAVQLNNGQLSSSTAYYLSQVLARRRRFDDAIKILAGALESAGPFPYREEAVKMMKTWDPSWKEKAPATAKTESSDSAPKTDTTPKKSDTPAKKN